VGAEGDAEWLPKLVHFLQSLVKRPFVRSPLAKALPLKGLGMQCYALLMHFATWTGAGLLSDTGTCANACVGEALEGWGNDLATLAKLELRVRRAFQ
jgi:hypothetical protein